ncbi:MAG: type II secretion system protein [Patescibacteria group bacterium]|nr:type II secretion system protein [Patescibacteria group bacterium]MDD5567003.1 type II secretion system protein [Patescibacteria group bacterium]
MKKKGFTLIELLVVIAIIGLLTTIGIISLQNSRSKARDAKRRADMMSLQSALGLYYDNNNHYPAWTEGTNCQMMGMPPVVYYCSTRNATGDWLGVGNYISLSPYDPLYETDELDKQYYIFYYNDAMAPDYYMLSYFLENGEQEDYCNFGQGSSTRCP